MAKAVFGIARSEAQAAAIADQLRAAGFSENDISVLFPDKQGTKDFAHEQHTKAPEGAATGATGGAVAPYLFAALIGTGERGRVFEGYLFGAALMIGAAIVELLIGVKAERQPLESVARPISSR